MAPVCNSVCADLQELLAQAGDLCYCRIILDENVLKKLNGPSKTVGGIADSQPHFEYSSVPIDFRKGL